MARQDNNIRAKLGDKVQIHENLNQHAWIILEDKVKLTLIEYEKQFEKSVDWWSPLSLFITIITAIIATKFEDFYFIPADTMRALFYFAALYFLICTVRNIYNACKQKKITIDDVIQKLRESSEQQRVNEKAEEIE